MLLPLLLLACRLWLACPHMAPTGAQATPSNCVGTACRYRKCIGLDANYNAALTFRDAMR